MDISRSVFGQTFRDFFGLGVTRVVTAAGSLFAFPFLARKCTPEDLELIVYASLVWGVLSPVFSSWICTSIVRFGKIYKHRWRLTKLTGRYVAFCVVICCAMYALKSETWQSEFFPNPYLLTFNLIILLIIEITLSWCRAFSFYWIFLILSSLKSFQYLFLGALLILELPFDVISLALCVEIGVMAILFFWVVFALKKIDEPEGVGEGAGLADLSKFSRNMFFIHFGMMLFFYLDRVTATSVGSILGASELMLIEFSLKIFLVGWSFINLTSTRTMIELSDSNGLGNGRAEVANKILDGIVISCFMFLIAVLFPFSREIVVIIFGAGFSEVDSFYFSLGATLGCFYFLYGRLNQIGIVSLNTKELWRSVFIIVLGQCCWLGYSYFFNLDLIFFGGIFGFISYVVFLMIRPGSRNSRPRKLLANVIFWASCTGVTSYVVF